MSLPDWLGNLRWLDVLDVALVAIVIYNLLLLIRGTRAVQIFLGILFLAAIYYVAGLTGLVTLEALLQSFLIFLPFAVIVLFRQEIRRALASFGRNPLWNLGSQQEVETTLTEIVLAATAMGKKRTGALIVIQRLEGLRNFVENGIVLDAKVSYDLLTTIFTPDTPLHDGAVIVQGDRVGGAACFLPLTFNPELSKEFGTRHRAAIGISQETDAVAVVVSEETGSVSIAIGGEMTRDLDAAGLRTALYHYLAGDEGPEGKR